MDAVNPTPDDVVIEIGPGEGTLTGHLIPRVGRVIAIEKDPELARRLRESGDFGRAGIVTGDALELDWHSLATGGFKVIGNIPYYITSPLIEKALVPPRPAVVVFLVQREVAGRVAALPGGRSYGALSVGVQAVARAEKLFTVKAGAFDPPPEVDSAVIRLTPLAHPMVADEEVADFRRFVVGLFSQRRKQLGRSLRTVIEGRAAAADALEKVGLDPTRRVETLEPADLVRLFRGVR